MWISSVFVLLTAFPHMEAARRFGAGVMRPRVVAGYEAGDDVPYVIVITHRISNGELTRACTGSIISDKWVLTAGHCVIPFCPEFIIYNNFTTPPSKNKYMKKVQRCIQHPTYENPQFGMNEKNDIGLLLIEPLKMSKYGLVSGADFRTLIGKPVKYYGFGVDVPFYKKFDNPKVLVQEYTRTCQARPLQYGEAIVVKCDVNDPAESFPAAFICVRPKCSASGQVGAAGDSGGPVIYKNKIVGVYMGGIYGDYIHSIYTAVSPYLDWIQNNMAAHVEH